MPSRTALRRDRIAQAVLDGAMGNLSVVAEALTKRLADDGVFQALEAGLQPLSDQPLSPETAEAVAALQKIQEEMAPVDVPDAAAVQQFLTWLLAFYTSAYLMLDDLHRQEAAETWVPRERRDEAVAAAYRDLVAVRRYVTGVLDERAADSLLDLRGDTPTQPEELRRHMEAAIRRLKNPDSHVPKPRIEGLEPDWAPAIRQLERGLANLETALRGLAAESSAATHARNRRDAALAAHRDMVTGSRSMLRGMYILSGQRNLVDTLRSPFSRRSATIDLEEEDEDFPGDEPFEPPAPEDGPTPPDGPQPEETGEEVPS